MTKPQAFIEMYRQRLDKTLLDILETSDVPALRIKEAMHYVLFPAGKRLRPLLVYLSGELLQVSVQALDIIAASIELIHCYSLVHDDLPAMDDDDFRRGRPSCHRAFDEATAILAGDALQALAMEVLLGRLPEFLPEKQALAIALEISRASGAPGMVSGQSLDISELQNPKLSEAALADIHALKTGKLISACINSVLCAGDFEVEKVDALQTFAKQLGLVFQMQDDYLDAYAKTAILGKNRASDRINNKKTYASFYSQEELKVLIDAHYAQASEALKIFKGREKHLLELMYLLQARG